MLPCSMRQIVETGRLRQQSLLAEADRDRRAARAAAPTEERSSEPDHPIGRGSKSSWGRLAAILGAIVQLRLSQL